MHIVVLVAVLLVCGFFAVSQPKFGEEFSPRRKKFNRTCQLVLAAAVVLSLGAAAYSSFFGTRPEDYQINTDVYCIELKTDGHRLLSFLSDDYKLQSHTVFGEEARTIMESAFGDMTRGTMVSWNETGSWQGKYNAVVYYTEEEYQRHLDGLSPVTIRRNSTDNGVMYYFTIVENGKIYCNIGGVKPYYCVKLSRAAKSLLF